ncbi:MAG: nicotinate-nucleotide--dimethylbenzimidazole phosphoribosyltransferase [Alphaproteobacteria bacterium]
MTSRPDMTDDMPPPSYAEIEKIIPELPGPDLQAGSTLAEVVARFARREGPPGEIVDWLDWLASWQGRARPKLEQPRFSLFACTPGMAGPNGFQQNQARLLTHTEGRSALHSLCAAIPADLRVYDMAITQPTTDPSTGAAVMDEATCVQSMAYGMMAIEPGVDVMVLAGLGAGHAAHALALGRAFAGCSGGMPDALPGLIRDWSDKALAAHATEAAKGPLHAMSVLGTPSIAALAGAIIAARMARQPVILADVPSLAAALSVKRLDKRATDHCRIQIGVGDVIGDWLSDLLELTGLPNPVGQMADAAGSALMLPVLKQSIETVLGDAKPDGATSH